LSSLFLALGASLAWGFADFFGPLVSRTLGSLRVLFWAQVGGLLAIVIAVAIRGQGPAGWAVLFAILASLGGMLGLFAYYRGMQEGAMSVVAPIAGISAIVPVIFGIATGDSPSATQVAGIACALAGVGLASIEHHEGSPRVAAGVGLALLVTALLLLVAVVGARHTPLKLRPRDLVIAAAVGIGDTIGNVLFAASSKGGLVSLTSVLASLYPVVTVLLAASVLHERVARMQKAGIVLTLTGVVLISF
jgi:drug/metabolite transporter (DMT)-like permease